jgi:hypothetical protein
MRAKPRAESVEIYEWVQHHQIGTTTCVGLPKTSVGSDKSQWFDHLRATVDVGFFLGLDSMLLRPSMVA